MDGIFEETKRLKKQTIWTVISMISGGLLAGFMIFALSSGELEAGDDRGIAVFFIIFGGILALASAAHLVFRKKSGLHADDHGITGRQIITLRCSMEDVAFVSWDNGYLGQNLYIELKNGKKYSFDYLVNAGDLCRYIKERIRREQTDLPDRKQLRDSLKALKPRIKKTGIGCLVTGLLLIPLIVLTAFLTGSKELSDFTSADWGIFALCAAVFVADGIIWYILLRKYVKITNLSLRLSHDLAVVLLRTEPLLPGKPLRMFLNDDTSSPFRAVVYGVANYEDVFYTLEAIGEEEQIVKVYESKIYPNYQDLEPELYGMTEIPLPTSDLSGQD
ncbi:MAG: hypothetical protein IJL78_08695 [Lachnospiraceae bacterium]|nr:hypothetical protein [Lachnospiraceae bacterium]